MKTFFSLSTRVQERQEMDCWIIWKAAKKRVAAIVELVYTVHFVQVKSMQDSVMEKDVIWTLAVLNTSRTGVAIQYVKPHLATPE